MADGNWDEILESYKFAQERNWGKQYVWLEKLVSQLLANLDLSILYPITSHYLLILYIGNRFEGINNLPRLSIELSFEVGEFIDKSRYKFSLTTGNEGDELFREFVESVYCSFEKSLEVFDEMFEKLKAATE